MVRLLVLLTIVVLAVFIVMRLVKLFAATRPTSQAGDETSGAAEAKLVKCVRCGAFVPRTDALPAPDGFLCSDPKCRSAS